MTGLLTRMEAGERIDATDTKTKNDIEDAFAFLTREVEPGSDEYMAIAAEMTRKTGGVPRQMFNYMRSVLNSGEPEQVAEILEYANALKGVGQSNLIPWEMYQGDKALNDALADYEFLSAFRGSVGAAEYLTDLAANPPSDAVTDTLKQHVKNLDVADVVSFFDEKGLDVDLGTGDQEAVIAGDYERLFESAYRQTGDLALSKNRALTELATIYGPNTVTGSSRLMRYPPQNFYPSSVTNPDWMSQQISDAVTEYVYGEIPEMSRSQEIARIVSWTSGEGRISRIGSACSPTARPPPKSIPGSRRRIRSGTWTTKG